MKKKILPILMIALTLVLLVCAMTVSVSANDSSTPSVSIDKFNLVFEDNVYLKYAVKFDGVADEAITENNIGMLYFNAPQTDYTEENATYTSGVVGFTTIGGTKYYTFEYRHISAKQMTDYVYSVAYIDVDGTRYYSAPNKFSVLEYAYAKLGKTGVASDNEKFIKLLNATLEQGAAAQEYFGYNVERLANDDYFLVEVIGGLLEDGFAKGLYNATETATLTAPEAESGFEFAGWKNSADEVVSTDNPASLTAFAKNDTYTASYKETVKYSEGLKFTSNGDGTCYVSGIGTCTDTDIVIPPVSPKGDRVASIGDRAFRNFTSLTSVTIPDSVTSIGDSAFYSCKSLTSVTIPDSVTSIGGSAFYNCTGLTSVIIPDSVTSIGNYAFRSCTGLTSVNISDIAAWCNISFVDYSSNPLYYAKNLYANGNLITELVIPDGVTSIYDYAFYNCTGLTSVTIPDSVTSIGNYAFYDCTSLTSVNISDIDAWCNISFNGYYSNPLYYAENLYLNGELITELVIPDGVTSIGNYAFYDCDGLTSVSIGNSVTSIGDSAFSDCTSITSVNISDIAAWCNISFNDYFSNPLYYAKNLYLNGELITELVIPDSVTSIGNFAFAYCSSLTSVTIPDGVTSIGDCSFSNCSSLTSVTIPDSVTSISEYAFYNCTSLISINVGTENEKYKSIDGNLYSKDGKTLVQYAIGKSDTTFIIPDSVTSIGDWAFYKCTSLKSVTIPDSVTSICDYAFSRCTSITSVTIPDSVTSIGYGAFGFCSSLTSITIPDSVTSIGDYAFYDCVGLTSVTIPDSVTSIGEGAFSSCSKLTSVTIPDSVTSIGYGAFEYCTSLTSVTIPDSVTSIGNYAFSGCFKLANVYYTGSEEEWNAISIGSSNTYLTNATRYYYSETAPTTEGNFWHYVDGVATPWPEYVAPVYSEGLAFASTGDETCYVSGIGTCTDTDIVIPPVSPFGYPVTGIGKNAFYECSQITSVTIPDSVTYIGESAFYYCTSLASIVMSENIDTISNKAFYNCKNLTSIVIPDNVTAIGNYAFYYCEALSSVAIHDNVTSIGNYAFFKCSNLEKVTIGNGVTTIGDSAFGNCINLSKLIMGNGVTFVGDSAFYLCTMLRNVYYIGSKEEWSKISFYPYNSYLTNATIHYNYVPEE